MQSLYAELLYVCLFEKLNPIRAEGLWQSRNTLKLFIEHVAEWSSHLTIDTRFQLRIHLDAGSNPTCGTGGSVPENHSPGPPMPCEGNWVVSWYLTQH